MTVTVLMPVFNAERYVGAAVESILGQTYRDFEFLIVNDGSTDRTREILSSYRDSRVRVVDRDRNHGITASLNHGLQIAQSDLVARQDADDMSFPPRLDRQVRFLRDRPDVAVVGSRGHLVDVGGRPIGVVDRSLDHHGLRWSCLFENPFVHTSVMFRRQAACEAGGFDPAFDGYCEDHALWTRLLTRYRGANLPERLISSRLTSDSLTGEVFAGHRPAADAKHEAFRTAIEQLARSNLKWLFPDRLPADADAELVAAFMLGMDEVHVPGFLDLYFDLLKRFREAHPEATASRDLSLTLARQLDVLAYRIEPPSRRAALRVYARAIREEPALAFSLPWTRAVLVLMAGQRGRRRLARLAHAS